MFDSLYQDRVGWPVGKSGLDSGLDWTRPIKYKVAKFQLAYSIGTRQQRILRYFLPGIEPTSLTSN